MVKCHKLDPNCSFPHLFLEGTLLLTTTIQKYTSNQLCVLVPGEMLQEICLQKERGLKNALKTAIFPPAFPALAS